MERFHSYEGRRAQRRRGAEAQRFLGSEIVDDIGERSFTAKELVIVCRFLMSISASLREINSLSLLALARIRSYC